MRNKFVKDYSSAAGCAFSILLSVVIKAKRLLSKPANERRKIFPLSDRTKDSTSEKPIESSTMKIAGIKKTPPRCLSNPAREVIETISFNFLLTNSPSLISHQKEVFH